MSWCFVKGRQTNVPMGDPQITLSPARWRHAWELALTKERCRPCTVRDTLLPGLSPFRASVAASVKWGHSWRQEILVGMTGVIF